MQVTKAGDRDGSLSVQLAVRRALDREQHDRYSLRVYAADDGDTRGASNSGSVDVLIDVLDQNDNRPVFEGEGRYEVTVPENLPLHTTILRVKAVDDDEGLNGQVRTEHDRLDACQHQTMFNTSTNQGRSDGGYIVIYTPQNQPK